MIASLTAEIDHLVIAARTLDEGVQWCEATLGVTPGPGGAHPLMGTHNRLLNIAAPAFPRAYLEIIAIDPAKQPTRAAGLHRWFDLDDAALQAGLAQHGPQLVHFVARVPDAKASLHALANPQAHIDRGHLLEASRATAAGLLEWQISVRDDGQRLFYGALPTLIQWGPVHPVDTMPASGLELVALAAVHPRLDTLRAALDVIGFTAIDLRQGPPNLLATLRTPRGLVTLESKGL
ncbi:VOC family protein [Variovorax sp. J22G21]|uniref:VOC family protein n=1 Tax=Variovorax fucosicus TaxID=3053517 RepID=UPI0025754782|nr:MULTISPECIES: VOC family protein [unclassified Variovorax]MDM0042416.1 VOC family protein [Variovorax sp. J22R193]MDM0054506.1 VOC family protein [Variovorax sp. J22G47]MDM0061021.1 VOC family protein [Variovorax sp. J22G21]